MYSKSIIRGYIGSTYASLKSKLQGTVGAIKIDRDTRIYGTEQEIFVEYYDTKVLTFLPEGTVILNDGGWLTNSTRAVMNSFLPHAYTVITDKGLWYVLYGGEKVRYHPDIVLDLLGERVLSCVNTEAQDKRDNQVRREIKTYANLYTVEVIKDLFAQARAHGIQGDCWLCLMHVKDTGETWGDVQHNVEHLESHMKEGYVMMSLLLNAYEDLKHTPTGNPNMDVQAAALYRNFYDNNDAVRVISKYLKKRLLVGAVQIH